MLVSGGARGVTAGCIVEWAKQSRASFVLLGRTRLIEEPAICAGIDDEASLKRVLLEQARADGQSLSPAGLLARVRDVKGNREIRDTLAAIAASRRTGSLRSRRCRRSRCARAHAGARAPRLGPDSRSRARRRRARRQAHRGKDRCAVRSCVRHQGGRTARPARGHSRRSAEVAVRVLVGVGALRQPWPVGLRDGERSAGEGGVGRVAPASRSCREIARLGAVGRRHGLAASARAFRRVGRSHDPAGDGRADVRR